MAATADSLQREVEALQACCPALCPAIVPNGYDTKDLVGLIEHAGKESLNDFENLLDLGGEKVTACCVCGADGNPSASGSESEAEDEDDAKQTLSFTLLTGVDFKTRNIVLRRAGFACMQCRALRSTCRMIRFAALRVGSRGEGSSHSDMDADADTDNSRQRLLLLAAHLAAVNKAPVSIQANPDALIVWLQELYCRAYALQVVASNLSGWRAVGPGGQPLRLREGKDVVAAAKLLLGDLTSEARAQNQKQQNQKQQKKKRGNAGTTPRQVLEIRSADTCAPAGGVGKGHGGLHAAQPPGQAQAKGKGKKRTGGDASLSGPEAGVSGAEAMEAHYDHRAAAAAGELQAAKKRKKAVATAAAAAAAATISGREAHLAKGKEAAIPGAKASPGGSRQLSGTTLEAKNVTTPSGASKAAAAATVQRQKATKAKKIKQHSKGLEASDDGLEEGHGIDKEGDGAKKGAEGQAGRGKQHAGFGAVAAEQKLPGEGKVARAQAAAEAGERRRRTRKTAPGLAVTEGKEVGKGAPSSAGAVERQTKKPKVSKR
ncbi:hypothetical protein VaNZ11_008032 [Volvox africanus]|uniref:Uncharacterized protein n=1 Tax=Volvox africanus TaxID=51714 RepID=A0ABQ5S4G4_9CHLO|nr:hypothetical protein VaNZ11_008032 [Volvox africanus]